MAITRRTQTKRGIWTLGGALPFKPSFTRCYDVVKYLGKGGFGSVFAAIRLSDKRPVAVKVIKKKSVRQWKQVKGRKVPQEVFFLHRLNDVEGVIHFYDGFNYKTEYLLIMERPKRCQDLFDYVLKFRGLNDVAAKAYFRQVVEVVTECAKRKILHQDIKMENIIVDLDTGTLKLIDFGLSRFFEDPNEMIDSYAGTFYAAPPEWFIHRRYNGLKAAVWSLGILLFVMLANYDPFVIEPNKIPRYNEIRASPNLSKDAQKLVRRCLTVDPSNRPSLEEVLDDPYLADAQKPPLKKELIRRAGFRPVFAQS